MPESKRDLWIVELQREEGEAVLSVLDTHQKAHGWYDHTCALCRARSRVSIGRDYTALQGLTPEAKKQVKEELEWPT
jgi:hypothetical protein